ncbi:DAK2 domain-containing protein [Streptomyces sp. XD-27]|uniref:DAK2 domain-containing protein n=1 Tax=Streptomyces sp. XD-27 TaxID=3062779 RepID=UPI0026F47659|nr:DAK2 domain-containing protein [Streptomyces sp. XD-27]WKX74463.1 DAK2 domain-containing protein [Streptomyces sp. XD-27]
MTLDALGRAREDIDAINVYPVADGDTGTNLYLTAESAARAVDAAFDGHAASGAPSRPTTADAIRAMAHGALIGARGNSGTILAQLLRGMADVLAADGAGPCDADVLGQALRHAAASAYKAVAHPVEGTVLTVAAAAADAAERAAKAVNRAAGPAARTVGGATAQAAATTTAQPARGTAGPAPAAADIAPVARAAYEGARTALAATPGQLDVLGRAGVVDAGGYGLVAVLGALSQALSGEAPAQPPAADHGRTVAAGPAARPPAMPSAAAGGCAPGEAGEVPPGPAFEVIYLLESDDAAVDRLRARLDALGDSLVVVGGDGLWNVHVHTDDAGAAVEAGVQAGRPYRIRITHLATAAAGQPHATHEEAHAAAREDADQQPHQAPCADPHDAARDRTGRPRAPEHAPRAVVAVVPGDGLAALYAEAGAAVVAVRPGEPPASGELVEAVRRAHAREVVLLPNDAELRHTAAAAAEQARTEGVRVALIPTRSAVQGIAALAVHEPGRRFDEDVVAMTAAAGATRCAELVVAEHQSWTMAGVCQAGDVLGLIDGDVAVIGPDLAGAAETVLDRMLAAGGEMVTLVLGAGVPDGVAERLERHVQQGHLAVDTVVYHGGQQTAPLIIGVE